MGIPFGSAASELLEALLSMNRARSGPNPCDGQGSFACTWLLQPGAQAAPLLGGSCVSAFGAYPNAGPRPGVPPAPHICNSTEIHDCMHAFHPLPPIVRKRAKGPWSLPTGGSPRAWGQLRGPEPPPAAPSSAPLPCAVAAAEVWFCVPCLASAPGGRKENHMCAPAGLLLATNPLRFSSSLCEIRYHFGNRALSVNLPRA